MPWLETDLLDRRTALRRSGISFAAVTGLGILGCGGGARGSAAAAPSTRNRRLHLRPPHLVNPTRVKITEADLESRAEIDLYGEGKDWIIELPRGRPLTQGFSIHGRDQARHIVIVGGAIIPTRRSDPSTSRLSDGTWAIYAERGFTGATGGTFRIRVAENGAQTDALPHDATPGAMKVAMERLLGEGSVQAVDGPGTPGGPWKFVPSDARLGRVALDLSDLQGEPRATQPTNYYRPYGSGVKLKQWRGTAHLEGLLIGGAACDEGINVQNPWAGAVLQMASCHVDVRAYGYHRDWHHPDAMQCYLGPAELRMERTDLLSRGSQAFIGQPRQTAAPRPLEELRDWTFRDVLFRTTTNPAHPGAAPGNPCYMEDDWPANNGNAAHWQWNMSRCFSSRVGVDGREVRGATLGYFNHYPHPPPPGLRIAAAPSRAFAAPGEQGSGIRYRSPGYAAGRQRAGKLRLRGETRVS